MVLEEKSWIYFNLLKYYHRGNIALWNPADVVFKCFPDQGT